MFKRWVTITGAVLVAAAGLLLTPATAPAQHGGGHGGGGHGGGGHGGGGHGGGYYGGGYGRGYYGGGYGRGYYGRGYYPGYYGGYYPGYYGNYDYAPDYDTYSAAPDYYTTPAPDYGNAPDYGTAPAAPSRNTARVTIHVPDPNADIWFNGTKTAQKGTERVFESPELEPGRDFTYDVRARWMEDGREVEQDRKIEVHAGDRLTANFPMPRATQDTAPRSAQPPADPDRVPVDGTSRPDRTAPDRPRSPTPPADRRAPSDQTSPDRPPAQTPPADRPPDR